MRKRNAFNQLSNKTFPYEKKIPNCSLPPHFSSPELWESAYHSALGDVVLVVYFFLCGAGGRRVGV